MIYTEYSDSPDVIQHPEQGFPLADTVREYRDLYAVPDTPTSAPEPEPEKPRKKYVGYTYYHRDVCDRHLPEIARRYTASHASVLAAIYRILLGQRTHSETVTLRRLERRIARDDGYVHRILKDLVGHGVIEMEQCTGSDGQPDAQTVTLIGDYAVPIAPRRQKLKGQAARTWIRLDNRIPDYRQREIVSSAGSAAYVVYLHLLATSKRNEHGSRDVTTSSREIAKRSGIPKSTLCDALVGLENMGAVMTYRESRRKAQTIYLIPLDGWETAPSVRRGQRPYTPSVRSGQHAKTPNSDDINTQTESSSVRSGQHLHRDTSRREPTNTATPCGDAPAADVSRSNETAATGTDPRKLEESPCSSFQTDNPIETLSFPPDRNQLRRDRENQSDESDSRKERRKNGHLNISREQGQRPVQEIPVEDDTATARRLDLDEFLSSMSEALGAAVSIVELRTMLRETTIQLRRDEGLAAHEAVELAVRTVGRVVAAYRRGEVRAVRRYLVAALERAGEYADEMRSQSAVDARAAMFRRSGQDDLVYGAVGWSVEQAVRRVERFYAGGDLDPEDERQWRGTQRPPSRSSQTSRRSGSERLRGENSGYVSPEGRTATGFASANVPTHRR